VSKLNTPDQSIRLVQQLPQKFLEKIFIAANDTPKGAAQKACNPVAAHYTGMHARF
jgi:hypothetical protein